MTLDMHMNTDGDIEAGSGGFSRCSSRSSDRDH